MGSVQKRGKKWRAEVRKRGFYRSKTFLQKKNAERWVYQTEVALEQDKEPDKLHTVAEAIDHYKRKITPTKKGRKWEEIRLDKFKSYKIANKYIHNVAPSDMADWRDMRLKQVKSSTVTRELKLWSSLFTIAWKEWGWIKENPCFQIRKPPKIPHRERIITPEEQAMIIAKLRRSKARLVFEMALETGMRISEIIGLTRDCVRPDHVILKDTKNGTQRAVPLSRKAQEIAAHVPFNISSGSVSGVFARAVNELGLHDLTFHDTRHTAATRLVNAGVYDMLELCKVFGWKDPRHAMIYFNPSPGDLAGKL